MIDINFEPGNNHSIKIGGRYRYVDVNNVEHDLEVVDDNGDNTFEVMIDGDHETIRREDLEWRLGIDIPTISDEELGISDTDKTSPQTELSLTSVEIGGRYRVVDEDGTHDIEIVGDYGDGMLEVRINGSEETQPLRRVDLEQLIAYTPLDIPSATHVSKTELTEQNKRENDTIKSNIKPKPIRKDRSELISVIGGIIFCMLIFCTIFYNCKSKNEKKKEAELAYAHWQDSIAHERDSIDAIISSKEYKDSIAAVRELRQDSIDRNTMVMIFKSDSLCHYSTICSEVKDIKSYQFTSQYNAKQQGKKICPECEEREDYYWGVKDGEYIYFEDINVQDD